MFVSETPRKLLIAGCYAALLGFAFFLLFYHLENHLLWEDEAETAVLAKNIVQYGLPRTYDGTNYLVEHGSVDETPGHVWIWSPWLQEYVTATSFSLFGPTTWAARAPFALVGWCSLLLLAWVAFKIYRSHWIAFSSAALLATSEVFLLHARQCRYYSISVFEEILLIYGIHQLCAQKRAGVWLAALALSLQFYSNYIIAVANLPALLVLAWLLRKQGKAAQLQVAVALGIFLAAATPWLVYAHPWGQSKMIGVENYFSKAFWYLEIFHFHFIPLCFLLLPLISWAICRRWQPTVTEMERLLERVLTCLLPLYLVTILNAPGGYLRYLLPVLPVGCLLAAVWIFRYSRWKALAVLVIVTQSACNFFAILTAYPCEENPGLRFPVVEFAGGLTRPYTDRLADVVDFFKTHARPGERILSYDPEFPLIFYTQNEIINGHVMGPPAGQLPDWFLPSSPSVPLARPTIPLPESLKLRYQMMTIPVHDSIPGSSIPEPDIYQYRSPKTLAPFIIYKLKTDANDHRLK